MPKAPLYNSEGTRIGEIDLNESVFGAEVKEALLHQVVVMQLANKRRGTASTKTISEVSGGGRKPWRQKGTGRARQGSTRSPLWPGGGINFGPKPRDYSFRIPKSARPVAMRSALSAKAGDDEIAVVEELQMREPKTKAMHSVLDKITGGSKVLLVVKDADDNVKKSVRNIPWVQLIESKRLNVYDVLNNERVLFTKDALQTVEEVWANA
ncbi:MAG: 50S ribosomal protein L4 [Firmicutes bacterium]|nr:50S ribosomal protein L4 [Bacillota bacterium]